MIDWVICELCGERLEHDSFTGEVESCGTCEAGKIERWIQDVLVNGRGLSKWEQDFIDSLEDQFTRTHWISAKQEEILDRIRTDKCP